MGGRQHDGKVHRPWVCLYDFDNGDVSLWIAVCAPVMMYGTHGCGISEDEWLDESHTPPMIACSMYVRRRMREAGVRAGSQRAPRCLLSLLIGG
ncbi:hypothetical protein RB213_012152 [Colletotrichum asianum]